jgi:hypothetical protein
MWIPDDYGVPAEQVFLSQGSVGSSDAASVPDTRAHLIDSIVRDLAVDELVARTLAEYLQAGDLTRR